MEKSISFDLIFWPKMRDFCALSQKNRKLKNAWFRFEICYYIGLIAIERLGKEAQISGGCKNWWFAKAIFNLGQIEGSRF
jgi:hypothetical protein